MTRGGRVRRERRERRSGAGPAPRFGDDDEEEKKKKCPIFTDNRNANIPACVAPSSKVTLEEAWPCQAAVTEVSDAPDWFRSHCVSIDAEEKWNLERPGLCDDPFTSEPQLHEASQFPGCRKDAASIAKTAVCGKRPPPSPSPSPTLTPTVWLADPAWVGERGLWQFSLAQSRQSTLSTSPPSEGRTENRFWCLNVREEPRRRPVEAVEPRFIKTDVIRPSQVQWTL
ncbi:hypothetical protein EYF80_048385 [Liparis tanakae]|uniref:Uncharacterized protein n=1 Tax=Liparis tanakae TaxID=230148 RepID=A0A4Z2FKD2_9TELE|nr:hypothetical protein EYF80_048385 [Liparis tanakae]